MVRLNSVKGRFVQLKLPKDDLYWRLILFMHDLGLNFYGTFVAQQAYFPPQQSDKDDKNHLAIVTQNTLYEADVFLLTNK